MAVKNAQSSPYTACINAGRYVILFTPVRNGSNYSAHCVIMRSCWEWSIDQHIHCLSEATASSSEESEESSDEETPHSEDASAPKTTPNGIILSFVIAARLYMLFL